MLTWGMYPCSSGAEGIGLSEWSVLWAVLSHDGVREVLCALVGEAAFGVGRFFGVCSCQGGFVRACWRSCWSLGCSGGGKDSSIRRFIRR